MTWKDDPEGRMIALLFGLAWLVLTLLVCASVMTNVWAFVLVLAMLTTFIGALVFVP